MKKWIQVLVLTIVGICSIGVIRRENKVVQTVVINEVCSKNGTVAIDELHIGDDYIELYNKADHPVSLGGWYLSDDPEKLDKCALPELELKPGERVTFFAEGKAAEGELSLNFKINSDGETIFLSDLQGVVADQVYIPSMEMDHAYARAQDGAEAWGIMEATPGRANQEAAVVTEAFVEPPVLSHESGFYEDAFVLTIDAGSGQKIYYTLDGSLPTEESLLYEDGIAIENRSHQENVINGLQKVVADWKDYQPAKEKADKAVVLRAIAVDEKHQTSEVVTETYFVGLEKYKEMEVASIVAEPEELWGEEGIFITGAEYDQWYLQDAMSSDGTFTEGWTTNYELANFWKRGRGTEVLGNVQLLENGEELLNQTVGVRTQGNFARLSPKKSMQLISRKSYSGSSMLGTKLFDEYDSHAVYVSAVPEKAYCLEFAKDRSLGLQGAKQCAVFVNGEYWYHAVLMEKFDEEYMAQHYGVDPDNVLLVKDREPALGEDAYYLFDDMINYLRDESISQEEKAVTLYEQFDVQSMIDWMCLNLYLGNDDVSYKKNCVMWRTIEPEGGTYGDCRWRWLVYDIDHAAVGAEPEVDDFSEFSIVSDNRYYWALSTSEHFCRQFVLTAMDLMNSSFRLDNVEAVLSKWGKDLTYGDSYFVKRPEYMIRSLRKEFDLTGSVETVSITVNDPEAGRVYINTIEAEQDNGTWEGSYFTDYEVKLTAAANPGYRFVGWSGAVEAAEDYIEAPVLPGGTVLTAIFEKE